MSSMMETAQSDQGNQNGVAQFTQNAPRQRIKRIGGRPLVFDGTELAMAMSYTPSLPYWYEINIYRTSDQRFVTTVRQFYQSSDEQDTVRAWECETLDAAIDRLTGYDAAQDVKLSLDGIDPHASAAELAACAMSLRADIKGHRDHYASLIGEFLFDLENGA